MMVSRVRGAPGDPESFSLTPANSEACNPAEIAWRRGRNSEQRADSVGGRYGRNGNASGLISQPGLSRRSGSPKVYFPDTVSDKEPLDLAGCGGLRSSVSRSLERPRRNTAAERDLALSLLEWTMLAYLHIASARAHHYMDWGIFKFHATSLRYLQEAVSSIETKRSREFRGSNSYPTRWGFLETGSVYVELD
ncbi:hypothetical protein BV25DRAFT_1841836 [Artomyces pyxidatus]|uniref:Uncharacterized protein n=1 Tax=Artomyces pyxidatus TaxID=48021 RepID=A0ACB8SMN1_9AGAM|nr:hypothetical protein BV25DRAFT_1841836 [Artomyces pyxidatus]